MHAARPSGACSPPGLTPLAPPLPRQIKEFVWLMTWRLEMSVEDWVFALHLFETCLTRIVGLIKAYSVRPLMLSCCMLALKCSSDARTLRQSATRAEPVARSRASGRGTHRPWLRPQLRP